MAYRKQVNPFPGHILGALVQMGKADNVIHQPDHPLGLGMDSLGKDRHILGLYHAVGHQLSTAGNGLQRGFQLVGDIGGELPAHVLPVFLFGYVKEEEYNPVDLTALYNRIGADAVGSVLQHHFLFAVTAAGGLLQKRFQLRASVQGENVSPNGRRYTL